MRTITILILAIAAFVLVALAPTPVFAVGNSPSKPVPSGCDAGSPVTLDGTLASRNEYGPPGWGENPAQDTRWTMTTLVLSEASKKMVASLLAPCEDVRAAPGQVQLWFSATVSKTLSKYKHHKVRVTGSLRAASGAPAEIQRGQLEVSEISAL
jgi:hypothetical protein